MKLPAASARIVTGSRPPNLRTVAQWLGSEQHRRWEELRQFIADHYPARLRWHWTFGGPRAGWRLRVSARRNLCTLVPERERFLVGVELPEAERARARAQGAALPPNSGEESNVWWLAIADESTLEQAKVLLSLKRPPRLPVA